MRNAFTLIELLTVIFIVAVLGALVLPVYSHLTEKGREAGCVSNLSQFGTALRLYLNEHNETFPTLVAARTSTSDSGLTIDNTLNAYADNPNVFICPSDLHGIGRATGTSYYWNSALNGQTLGTLNFMTITDITTIPVLGDKEGFHPYLQSKVNILYCDGHVTKDLTFSINP